MQTRHGVHNCYLEPHGHTDLAVWLRVVDTVPVETSRAVGDGMDEGCNPLIWVWVTSRSYEAWTYHIYIPETSGSGFRALCSPPFPSRCPRLCPAFRRQHRLMWRKNSRFGLKRTWPSGPVSSPPDWVCRARIFSTKQVPFVCQSRTPLFRG